MSQPPQSLPPYPSEPPHPPSIQYATAIYARPGLLSSVGICSIIVGGLSALMSLSGIFSGIAYVVMSHAPMNLPIPARAPATQATTAPAAGAVQMATFSFHVDLGASVTTIVEAVLSLCAAVLLIVAGSLMLRDSPMSWRLHRLYILIKLPLIAVAAVAMWWTYTSLFNGMMNMGGNQVGPQISRSVTNMMAVFEAGIMTAIALIYPIALLFILATKTSKDYLKLLQERVLPAK